jgi:hypothetical protein
VYGYRELDILDEPSLLGLLSTLADGLPDPSESSAVHVS